MWNTQLAWSGQDVMHLTSPKVEGLYADVRLREHQRRGGPRRGKGPRERFEAIDDARAVADAAHAATLVDREQ